MSQLLLQLLVLDQSTFNRVGQQHRARTQATLAHNSRGVDVQNADFAGKNDQAIRGDDVASRTQAVAIESGSDQ